MKRIIFIIFKECKIDVAFIDECEKKYDLEIEVFHIGNILTLELLHVLKRASRECLDVVGIRYPIFDNEDYEVIREFLVYFLQKGRNVCYFPKPNLNGRTLSFSLFGVHNNWNLEHLEVEIAYHNNILSRVLRNKVHKILRDEKGIYEYGFIESNMLSNIANDWEYCDITKNRKRDLIERYTFFYPYPTAVTLMVNNECNLSCIMCPYHANTYKKLHKNAYFKDKKNMDMTTVKSVVKYILNAEKDGYYVALDITAVGEPLMHQSITKFVEYAKKNGVKYVSLTTNGVLLSRDISNKLLDGNLDVLYISIDGATQEIYAKIRKGGELLEVEDNLIYLIESARRRKQEIEIYLNCVLVGFNNREQEIYKSKWSAYRDIIKGITFSKMRQFNKDTGDEILSIDTKRAGYRVCSSPWNDSINVYPDGKIFSICCPMSEKIGWNFLEFGDISDDKLAGLNDIWGSDIMKSMRKENYLQVFNKFSDFCEKCERRICGVEHFDEGNYLFNKDIEEKIAICCFGTVGRNFAEILEEFSVEDYFIFDTSCCEYKGKISKNFDKKELLKCTLFVICTNNINIQKHIENVLKDAGVMESSIRIYNYAYYMSVWMKGNTVKEIYKTFKKTDIGRILREDSKNLDSFCAELVRILDVVPKHERDSMFYDSMYLNSQEYKLPYKESTYFPIWKKIVEHFQYQFDNKFSTSEEISILEVGCGNGRFAEMLYDNGIKSYKGIDFSAVAIRDAQERFINKEESNFAFMIQDLYEIDFKSEKYSYVVILEVLEHINNDLSLFKALPHGMHVIASVPNFHSEGHVRVFKNKMQILERYDCVLNIEHIYEFHLPCSNNGIIFLLFGKIR